MSSGHAFHVDLGMHLPALRAFARSLARDHALADDLTQEALTKAWAARDSYQPGTNLRAWLFTILRNAYYSSLRKHRREVEDADGALSARLAVAPSQDHSMAMVDFREALALVPPDQREAIVLIGAVGLSYEEAADIAGCAVGTVKSRVNRARKRLADLLHLSEGEDMMADGRMDAALSATLGPYAA